jgi:hypothetical protein
MLCCVVWWKFTDITEMDKARNIKVREIMRVEDKPDIHTVENKVFCWYGHVQ